MLGTEIKIIKNELPYFHKLKWKIGIPEGTYYVYKKSDTSGFYWINKDKTNPSLNVENLLICINKELIKLFS